MQALKPSHRQAGKGPGTKGMHGRQGPKHPTADIRVRNMRREGMRAKDEETVTESPTEPQGQRTRA